MPDSHDLTPAAARARWHRVRPKPRRTAVAHSPACLAQELGNRPQPHTEGRSPASFESIVRIRTLHPCSRGPSWGVPGSGLEAPSWVQPNLGTEARFGT